MAETGTGQTVIKWLKDIVYGEGSGRPLKMHLLLPWNQAGKLMPAVIWVHGGGWEAGNKEEGLYRSALLCERGYVCASIEYRLSQEAVFPAQIEDCKCAVRFIRANAKSFGVDPERIGVWGASAGGHLVALLGTSAGVKELEGSGGNLYVSSSVQAVCDWCGPTDFFRWDIPEANRPAIESAVRKLFGGTPEEKRELAILANPVTHIRKNAPPFFIIHGDMDDLVPLSHSILLHEALQKAGVESELMIMKGAGHGFDESVILQKIFNFFDKHLKA